MENGMGDVVSVDSDFANSGTPFSVFLVHTDKDLIYAYLIPKQSF